MQETSQVTKNRTRLEGPITKDNPEQQSQHIYGNSVLGTPPRQQPNPQEETPHSGPPLPAHNTKVISINTRMQMLSFFLSQFHCNN